MDEHGLSRSQTEIAGSLEQAFKRLELLESAARARDDIVDGLDSRVEANTSRVARAEDAARAALLLREAQDQAVAASGEFPVIRPQRDRRGLRVIRGGLAALIPLVLALAAWTAAQAAIRPHHAHHRVVAVRRADRHGGEWGHDAAPGES